VASPPTDARAAVSRGGAGSVAGLALAAVLAVFAYAYGLDSPHIPKNGDEYAYEHITRLTAASGSLLPLRSDDLPVLRNTKPPLLFWQGIASTHGGRDWTLVRLRWPSVVYTLLTAVLAGAVGFRLSASARAETGARAALVFLAFYSTYRYGRPFLTNAPETFFVFLPFAAFILWRPSVPGSRILAPALTGLSIGVALLYKSFALVLPAALALAGWHLRLRRGRLGTFLRKDAPKVAVVAVVALAVFASWPLLDPEPASIWRDFVLRENAGKFDLPGGYLPRLLWGPSSVWVYSLGYPANAGLLFFPVLGLAVLAWRRRAELTESETLLWTLVLAFLLFFALPSQRSARYLLPAMPALAVLLALRWHQIGRWLFALSLGVTAVVLTLLGLLSWRLGEVLPALRERPILDWGLLGLAGAVVLAGLLRPVATRAAVPVAILLAYLSLAHLVRPFDGPAGQYGARARAYARGRDVLVPYDFVAKEERYRFLLPGANVLGYRQEHGLAALAPMPHDALVVVQTPLHGDAEVGGVLVGRRLDIRGRQTAAELREVLSGRLSPALLVEEWLVEEPGAEAQVRAASEEPGPR
jgi:4-amino-4-deoxy-L-arabinose transferase-like glycosyltransferase